ncbi:MAG: hypothetical protein KKA73_26020 [Chloroflexi bacterium]|nr:hypothetical protein [Chloroflexota bacterium]MBU1751156.1 hypothetical protein [Chloroflexota bacterium]
MNAIRDAVQSYWEAAKSLYEEIWLICAANLVWAGLTLLFLSPLVLIWAWLGSPILPIALLFLLPTPPAAGMYHLAHEIVYEDRMPTMSMFWTGLRTYWRPSLSLTIIGLGGTILLWFNAEFYASLGGTVGPVLSIVFLYGLVVWLTIQVYTLPLLVEQTDKRLTLVYRNAFLMTIGNLIFNVVFVVLLGATIALSIALTIPMLLVTMGFVALLTTHSLLASLQARGLRPPRRDTSRREAS